MSVASTSSPPTSPVLATPTSPSFPPSFTLSRKASHLSHLSITSATSSSSSKSFGRTLHDRYTHWQVADYAVQRLPQEEQECEESKQQLDLAKQALARLQQGEPVYPSGPRKRPSLKQVFRKNSKNESIAHLPIQPVPEVDEAEIIEAAVRANELERQVHIFSKKVETTKSLAETLDQCYDSLKASLDNGPLPSWRYLQCVEVIYIEPEKPTDFVLSGNEEAILRAETSVAAREKAYQDSLAATEALHRAQRAVRSAHKNYMEAIGAIGSVCQARGSIFSAMGDEQSRESTYREATEYAQKAQVCFNECLRVLQDYWEVIHPSEAEDCEQLRQAGLLQAMRLYQLMYGGRALDLGIKQQTQLILDKQEIVRQRLTHLAVGIQNCTTDCERVLRTARENRDIARRHLVALWMKDGGYAVPQTPW